MPTGSRRAGCGTSPATKVERNRDRSIECEGSWPASGLVTIERDIPSCSLGAIPSDLGRLYLEPDPTPKGSIHTMKPLICSAALFLTALLQPQPAECYVCPTYQCYAPCGPVCACISTGGQGGACASIQQIKQMEPGTFRVIE